MFKLDLLFPSYRPSGIAKEPSGAYTQYLPLGASLWNQPTSHDPEAAAITLQYPPFCPLQYNPSLIFKTYNLSGFEVS